MAKTQLTTDWVCIATAGHTLDGREITVAELTEMAESYNPNVYTALIWLEHYRFFGNLGKVCEVKIEEIEGKTKLFAKLNPNSKLIEMNERGQKIFTSVEIMPNFQKTGKNYLYGLAVTDSPASTGTTALNFSTRGVEENTLFGNAEPLQFNLQADEEERVALNFFKRLFSSSLKSEQPSENNTVDPDNKKQQEETFSMTKEELTALINTAVASAFSKQTSTQPTVESTETQASEGTVSVEEFNALKTQLEELQKKFSEMSKEATAIPSGTPAIENQFTLTTAI